MLEYNLVAEYAMLFIIFIIMISFSQDYEEQNLISRFLRHIFGISFLSSLLTITTMEIHKYKDHIINYVSTAYIVNTAYFIVIPIITVIYLFLCLMLPYKKHDDEIIKKNFKMAIAPYAFYLLILLTNIHNSKVFSINAEVGYIRGDWYQIPFVIAGFNIFLVCITIIRNRKLIHKHTIHAILINMCVASFLLFLVLNLSQVILTGLCNTTSILAFYLFTQNKRKKIDPLTDSNNIVALRHDLAQLVDKDVDFSIYVLSLRGFKSINERNGLDFGDNVLKSIVNRLLEFNFISYERLYRYSGDEFAIISLENKPNKKNINTILELFKKPFSIETTINLNQTFNILSNVEEVKAKQYTDVQLDMVCARVDNKVFGSSVKELISAIDFSTSQLKQHHGAPFYLHDESVMKSIIEKNDMIEQIKNAIKNRKFKIYYQPMYSTSEKHFTQAEALVRMIDEDGSLISPAKFIDIAEITGLIVPMTDVILDIVCEDFRNLIDAHEMSGDNNELPLKSISINFPYHFFLANDMESKVIDTISNYGLSSKHIKIEITERTFIANENVIQNVMESMRSVGFIFELDDFGVDYSNMSTFMNLPIQIIKIDRSVLLSAMDNEKNKKFFEHLVAGINATDRIIVVEGVEEQDQLKFVLSCECEYIQGYIFSKPLSFEDFCEFNVMSKQNELISKYELLK